MSPPVATPLCWIRDIDLSSESILTFPMLEISQTGYDLNWFEGSSRPEELSNAIKSCKCKQDLPCSDESCECEEMGWRCTIASGCEGDCLNLPATHYEADSDSSQLCCSCCHKNSKIPSHYSSSQITSLAQNYATHTIQNSFTNLQVTSVQQTFLHFWSSHHTTNSIYSLICSCHSPTPFKSL